MVFAVMFRQLGSAYGQQEPGRAVRLFACLVEFLGTGFGIAFMKGLCKGLCQQISFRCGDFYKAPGLNLLMVWRGAGCQKDARLLRLVRPRALKSFGQCGPARVKPMFGSVRCV